MKKQHICSECGKPLGSDTPQGLCPACLLKAGLGSGVSVGASEQSASASARFVAPSPEELQQAFPQLEILELVGQGGMGAVYKARQTALDRVVALKILPPGIGGDGAFTERFTREAKALAKLNHPGIVTLYEFGQADGLFFFLMEFVDGVTLRHLMGAERLSPRDALAIVPRICDALQYAHDQGIVHRDIKPENILLDRLGRVKVADFGLAKLIETREEFDGEGACRASTGQIERSRVMGTPQYMAPEQSEAPTSVDHRADIYSLGVVLYQMLTGELPGKPFEPPSRKVHIDVRLDEIVLKALEREPERRYQQVSMISAEIETISRAADTPSRRRCAPITRRRRSVLFVATAIAFMLLLAAPHFSDLASQAYSSLTGSSRAPESPRPPQPPLSSRSEPAPPAAHPVQTDTQVSYASVPAVQKLQQETVELVAVTTQPAGSEPYWWRPDGQPYTGPALPPRQTGDSPEPGLIQPAFMLRIKGEQQDQDQNPPMCKTNPSAIEYYYNRPVQAARLARPPYDTYEFSFRVPDNIAATDVSVGRPGKTWQVVGTSLQNPTDSKAATPDKVVSFLPPTDSTEGAKLSVVCTTSEATMRLLVITHDGQQHILATREPPPGIYALLTAVAPKLRASDIKEVQLQTLPYEWITFKNVALRPVEPEPPPPA